MARRRVRLPRAAYPYGAERAYEAAVGAAIERAWGNGTERIVAAYGRALAQREDAAREDARTIPGELDAVLAGIHVVWGRLLDKQAELLPVDAGNATAAANARSLVGQLGAVVAVDPIAAEPWLGPVLDAWRQSNVALISALGKNHAKLVSELVADAWTNGRTTDWLQRELVARLGISRRRGELIARDQVGKLNGQLTMVRQSTYGITHYRWMTSMDERVRQHHADRHGERFAWAVQPDDGHPGMPIQCRCVAEPDIDDALAELERDGKEVLALGPADADALSRAVDELGQWAPDKELLHELKVKAHLARNQTQPNKRARRVKSAESQAEDGGPGLPRLPRAEKKLAKTLAQEAAKEARQASTESVGRHSLRLRGRGTLPLIDTSAVQRPPAIRGLAPSDRPPAVAPIHPSAPLDTVLMRGDVPQCDFDAVTLEGLEERKKGGRLRAGAAQLREWVEVTMVQMDNTLLALKDFNPVTDRLIRGSASTATEFIATIEQLRETPKQFTLLIADCPDESLEEVNAMFDRLRVLHPDYRILVARAKP